MNIEHHVVAYRGTLVGDLVSLGRQLVFYTTHPALKDLDGDTFPSVEEAEAEVSARLAGQPPAGSA